MAKNRDNVRVYGDLESEVFLAPKGSTLPTTLTDPETPFESLGWLSEDGISLTVSTDSEKFKAWQGGATLRVKVTSTEKTITFQALEETPGVTELYYDHAAPVVTTGVAKIDLPEGIGTVERAAVFKFVDGGVTKFLCCELIQITERGDLPHTNSDMTMYEFTAEIVGDSFILTNAPSYTE
ncbi:phage tail tube protein [Leucobacter japonicus]|uniref:phage tail tube protein n=1 Tax=Leucobacter japonicus TaxID=1461259 RepID=UPI0006A7D8E4|nr:hypothetical protein [Leucobacter japonicus]